MSKHKGHEGPPRSPQRTAFESGSLLTGGSTTSYIDPANLDGAQDRIRHIAVLPQRSQRTPRTSQRPSHDYPIAPSHVVRRSRRFTQSCLAPEPRFHFQLRCFVNPFVALCALCVSRTNSTHLPLSLSLSLPRSLNIDAVSAAVPTTPRRLPHRVLPRPFSAGR